MTTSFDDNNPSELNFDKLYERIKQQRMEELFSEPYDGDMEEEDWILFARLAICWMQRSHKS